MTKDPTKPHIRLDVHYDSVLGDISDIIEAARKSGARSINSIMTATYWLIGRCMVEYEQGGQARAGYGGALLERLSADLASLYGRGFGVDNLQRFRAFYIAHPPNRIYATMSRKSGFGQSDEKYAMLSRIFQAELSEEANEAIPRNEILQTASAESSLSSIVSCFTLPWSAYVRLLSVRGSNWHLILLNAGETKG